MLRRGMLAILLGGGLMATSDLSAQQGQAGGGSLAEAARQAGQNFQPVAAQDAARAKEELAAAMSQLDAFLRTGAPYKAVGWKKYLQWNDLVNMVQGDWPPAADQINALLAKTRANVPGLERPEFTHLRDALARFAAATAATGAAGGGNLAAEYPKRMEELARQLDAYAKDRGAGDAALAIGRTLGWLEANGQARDLVGSIRRTYGHPNLFGYASRRFAATGIERDVDQLTAVNDNILGTQLHGTARMVGHTTLSLDENPNAASMNILLGGTAWSNNVGYNGPVTIYSTGTTSVSARKAIWMNADGMFSYGRRLPAARGATSTTSVPGAG